MTVSRGRLRLLQLTPRNPHCGSRCFLKRLTFSSHVFFGKCFVEAGQRQQQPPFFLWIFVSGLVKGDDYAKGKVKIHHDPRHGRLLHTRLMRLDNHPSHLASFCWFLGTNVYDGGIQYLDSKIRWWLGTMRRFRVISSHYRGHSIEQNAFGGSGAAWAKKYGARGLSCAHPSVLDKVLMRSVLS